MVNAAPRGRPSGAEAALMMQGPKESCSRCSSLTRGRFLHAKEGLIKATETSMLCVDASVKCLTEKIQRSL